MQYNNSAQVWYRDSREIPLHVLRVAGSDNGVPRFIAYLDGTARSTPCSFIRSYTALDEVKRFAPFASRITAIDYGPTL